MSLAFLFNYLLLNIFRMLVHPSLGACDLLWIYFMCCIALVRCVLVLRCGSAGVEWYSYAGWNCAFLTEFGVSWQTLVQVASTKFYENSFSGSRTDTCRRTDGRDENIRRFCLSMWTRLIRPEDIWYYTVYVYIRPYTYTCVYIYTHTHTHTHTFAYIHIQNIRHWISCYIFGGLLLYFTTYKHTRFGAVCNFCLQKWRRGFLLISFLTGCNMDVKGLVAPFEGWDIVCTVGHPMLQSWTILFRETCMTTECYWKQKEEDPISEFCQDAFNKQTWSRINQRLLWNCYQYPRVTLNWLFTALSSSATSTYVTWIFHIVTYIHGFTNWRRRTIKVFLGVWGV